LLSVFRKFISYCHVGLSVGDNLLGVSAF